MDTRDIRFQRPNLRKILKERHDSSTAAPLPGRLSYQPSPHEEYSFENNRICLNGMDVLSMVEGGNIDVELLACLAGAVEEYRHAVWNRYGTNFKPFNAAVQGLLEKLFYKLGYAYETMTGGIRVQLQGGRLWINDIDPKVVLALFLSNPTDERRRYLEGIRTKLALILEGKAAKSSTHAVLEEARTIFIQIVKSLENTASPHSTPLLAAIGDLGRS